MKTITEHIRVKLFQKIGLIEQTNTRNSDEIRIEIKKMTNSLENIVLLARPRLIMGGLRYGGIKKDHDYVKKFTQNKLDMYEKTGNFEYLIDLVNCCAIEGVLKTHPAHHFKGEDREN